MEIILSLHIEALEEGGYLATCDDLPGLVAQGRTIAETIEIAQDVARRLIESYREHGDPLPPCVTIPQADVFKHVDIQMPVGVG